MSPYARHWSRREAIWLVLQLLVRLWQRREQRHVRPRWRGCRRQGWQSGRQRGGAGRKGGQSGQSRGRREGGRSGRGSRVPVFSGAVEKSIPVPGRDTFPSHPPLQSDQRERRVWGGWGRGVGEGWRGGGEGVGGVGGVGKWSVAVLFGHWSLVKVRCGWTREELIIWSKIQTMTIHLLHLPSSPLTHPLTIPIVATPPLTSPTVPSTSLRTFQTTTVSVNQKIRF